MGGQTHAIAQQGRPATACSYELSPGSSEFGKDAATGTFSVGAPNDCVWTSTSSAPWLLVSSGNQGAGNGTVSYEVARNLEVVALLRRRQKVYTFLMAPVAVTLTLWAAPTWLLGIDSNRTWSEEGGLTCGDPGSRSLRD